MIKKTLVLGAIFGAVAFAGQDWELTAPTATNSGYHRVMACHNGKTGESFTVNTRESVDHWRPFGANTREFNDAVTGKKISLRERDQSHLSCRHVKYS